MKTKSLFILILILLNSCDRISRSASDQNIIIETALSDEDSEVRKSAIRDSIDLPIRMPFLT